MLTFDMKLNDFKRGFIDTTKRDAERGVNRGLIYMGGWIKRVAKNSIKNAAKHSKKSQAGFLRGADGEVYSRPGQPPLNKLGLLKDNIFSTFDWSARVVKIGPAKLNGRGNAPAALELGLPTQVMVGVGASRHMEMRPMQARPYMRPALKKAMEPKNLAKFFAKLTTQETISISA